MELLAKLEILAAGARYDVSCASSGSRRGSQGGVGNGAVCGVCHSWTADGRCVSLLKILLSNQCIFDCAYCVNRRSHDTRRVMLTPEEVADLTIGFYRRNYIEGLFLSTGVVRDPDYTMELLIAAARRLREIHRFNGYIHLKMVPGADPLLVAEAGRHADRLSVNIELPTRQSLALLAPDKSRETVLTPMRTVAGLIAANQEERRILRKTPPFAPAGQSTQMIVGATPDSDLQIIRLAEGLYRRLDLKRVYYSAYIPVAGGGDMPGASRPPMLREHRLYQADWLMRSYGFAVHELLDEENPCFDREVDPKTGWALRHLHLFPVEVNRAEYGELLRVPGIGVQSARRIVRARRQGHLGPDELGRLGVVMKRARYFVTARGKFLGDCTPDAAGLRARLATPGGRCTKMEQLSLFDGPAENLRSVITGEI